MDARIAALLLAVLAGYGLAGMLFSLPFLLRGVGRIDPAAARGTRGFRLAILPGVVMLWPWLAWRWARSPS
jgi:hypothetical protein